MTPSETLTVGALTLTIGRLNLGGFKSVRDELALVQKIAWGNASGPSNAELDAMVTVIWRAASASDPVLSLEELQAQFDALPFTESIDVMANGIAMLLRTSGAPPMEDPSPGEAPSQPS